MGGEEVQLICVQICKPADSGAGFIRKGSVTTPGFRGPESPRFLKPLFDGDTGLVRDRGERRGQPRGRERVGGSQ